MLFKKSKSYDNIKEKTDEIVVTTENFLKNVDKKATGNNTVSIMINGEKTQLNQEDYHKLKVQKQNLKRKLKKEIMDISNEYKEAVKKEYNKKYINHQDTRKQSL